MLQNLSTKALTDSFFPCFVEKNDWHVNLRVIIKEPSQEKVVQITKCFDRTRRELLEPIESQPFEQANEEPCQDYIKFSDAFGQGLKIF